MANFVSLEVAFARTAAGIAAAGETAVADAASQFELVVGATLSQALFSEQLPSC